VTMFVSSSYGSMIWDDEAVLVRIGIYIATRYCFMRLIFTGNFEMKEQILMHFLMFKYISKYLYL
jgi:hypothetical protein